MNGTNDWQARGGQGQGRLAWGTFLASGAAGAPGWRRGADAQRAPQSDSGASDGNNDDNESGAYGPQGDQVDDAYAHALSAFAEGEDEGRLATRDAPAGMASGALLGEAQRRMQARQLIREFLRAVPRAESETTLAFLRPDGEARVVTRAQLSAAIDRLRPRQRQIIRLGIEERWPRQKVCVYLRNISIKTFERDQVEALDLLAQL